MFILRGEEKDDAIKIVIVSILFVLSVVLCGALRTPYFDPPEKGEVSIASQVEEDAQQESY